MLAAYLARLLGLPGHPPEAARAARDKRLTRERLKAGGFLTPAFISVDADADPAAVLLARGAAGGDQADGVVRQPRRDSRR